jgi:hypothetical protein
VGSPGFQSRAGEASSSSTSGRTSPTSRPRTLRTGWPLRTTVAIGANRKAYRSAASAACTES